MSNDLKWIRSPKAIRNRCGILFDYVSSGRSPHLKLNMSAWDSVVEYVCEEIRSNYPGLDIPYHSRWQHFAPWQMLELKSTKPALDLRTLYDLVIVSVLLDAGAGMQWRYKTKDKEFSKSEGLAIASYDMFVAGLFGRDSAPQVDAERLQKLTESELALGFQISETNPMNGLQGRCKLLQSLGKLMSDSPDIFRNGRPGDLIDHFYTPGSTSVKAADILTSVLDLFSPIWPSKAQLNEQPLGDVWTHKALADQSPVPGMVPFHKLSQWLTYSLCEPLEWQGITIENLGELTGLPEYRNGGLFVDFEVLKFSDDLMSQQLGVDHEAIIEWRACTVILLDKMGDDVRKRLNLSSEEFPLAKVLQGGTWSAGRKIARERRSDGGPPLNLLLDGTVF